MLRTALAAVIGATIVVGALAGCDNSAASTPTIQAPAAQPHQFTTPAVAPAPLPDIEAIAERATEAKRVAAEKVASDAKRVAEPQEFTGYTCEPTADAKFDHPADPNMITNKACNGVGRGDECIGYGCSDEQNSQLDSGTYYDTSGEAQSDYYADDESIGDNGIDVDTYCDPGTGMMLDGTPC